MRLAVVSLLLVVSCVWAAPPEVPKELKVKPGQLVRIVAKGEGEIGTLRNFPDDVAFFDELAPKKGERRFVFQTQTLGTYVIGFWTKGELEGSSCTITVEGDTLPPAPPTPVPPVPPVPTLAYYFMVVRADGPASPEFTRIMSDPAWAQLQAKKHKVKDFTQTRARQLGLSLPVGMTLPVVVTLRETGGKSIIVRSAIPLPTTGVEILRLEEVR